MKIKFYAFAFTLLGSTVMTYAQIPPNNSCATNPTPYVPRYNTSCGHPTNWAYIQSVVTTGGSVNFSNLNTNCGNTVSSYSDYTGSGMYVKQEADKTVDVKVTWKGNANPSGPMIQGVLFKIFVDWNRNGLFEPATEWATAPPSPIPNPRPDALYNQTSGTGTITLKVKVPLYAKEGQTRMRIMCASRLTTIIGDIPDACSGTAYGEAEDYVFEVVNPCLPPNVISVANLDYKSADFAWTPKLNAEFYEYIITPVDTIPHDTVVGFSFTKTPSLEVDTFKCDTKYYVMVRAICDTANKRFSKEWNKSTWARDSFVTQPCCYTPDVKVDEITSTTARAQWDPVQTAIGYEYAVTTQTEPPQQGTLTVNTIVGLQGLTPKVTHFVFVRSRCVPTPLSDWAQAGFKTLKYTTVNQLMGKEFSMDAYPNPLKDVLTVQVNGKLGANARLTIIDLTGKVVYNAAMTTEKVQINASKFAPGMYIVKYSDEVHNEVMRVSK